MDDVRPEMLPEPSTLAFAAAGLLLMLGAVGCLMEMPTHRSLIGVGLAALALLGGISGWLFRRKGYSFVEGWFAGVVLWPLAIPFGIFGPPRPHR